MFGGSFDPIHNAHLIVARLAIEQLRLDRVLFLVAGAQPFKQGLHAATAAQRLRMVELALEGMPGLRRRWAGTPAPRAVVHRRYPARAASANSPTAELVLIMGADVASGLADWREPDRRAGAGEDRGLRTGNEDRAAGLGAWGFDSRPIEIRVPAIEISSTAIRARAAAGLSLAGWVPLAVADYIVASQLYRSPAG